jgi:hypothetical protein
MPIYKLEEIPETVSWIRELSSTQAVEQCNMWGLEPENTLEENRVLLKQFVKDYKKNQLESTLTKQQSLTGPHITAPVTPNTVTTTTTTSIANPATTTSTLSLERPITTTLPSAQMSSSTVTDPLVTPTPLTNPQQALNPTFNLDPNLQTLVQALQTMTLNAVANTACTITSQIKSLTSSKPSEDIQCPPYVRDLLKELPKTSGDDPHQTLKFLKELHKIIETKLVPEKVIILNVVPYTQNRLREFWMTVISQNLNWEQLLNNVRQTFFTPHILRDMQNRYLYRPQNHHESLADYVRDIQILFAILFPSAQETEIFQTIFQGINQQTRTTFAGLKPINSIQDLMDIAPLSASLVGNKTLSQDSNSSKHLVHRPSQAYGSNYFRPSTSYTPHSNLNASRWTAALPQYRGNPIPHNQTSPHISQHQTRHYRPRYPNQPQQPQGQPYHYRNRHPNNLNSRRGGQ